MKKTSKKQAGALSTAMYTSIMGMIEGDYEHMLDTFDGGSVQNFIDAKPEERLIMLSEWFNNGCKLNKVFANTFILGEVFKARATEGDTRLYFWESFDKKFIQNNLERKIDIRTDLRALKQYRLPTNMRDGDIQKECENPGYMNFDTFFCVAYLLIFEKETAKECFGMELSKTEFYVFHVKMDDGTIFAVNLYWVGGGWSSGSYTFGTSRLSGLRAMFLCTFPKLYTR